MHLQQCRRPKFSQGRNLVPPLRVACTAHLPVKNIGHTNEDYNKLLTASGAVNVECAVEQNVSTATCVGRHKVGTEPGFNIRRVFDPSNRNHNKALHIYLFITANQTQSTKPRIIKQLNYQIVK